MCTEDSQIKEAYSLIHATKATVTLSFLTVIDLTTILKITSTKEADICGWTVGFISLEECTTTIEDSKFENVSFGAVFMSKGKASLHNVTFGSETISSNFSGYMRNVRCVQSGEIEADGITVTNANGDEMFGHYIDAVGCRAQGEEFKGETAPFFRPILKNVTITQPESMNDYFYLTFDTTGLYPCYTRFETETGYHPPMPSSIRNRPNIYNNYDFETYVNTSRAEGRIRKAAIPDDNRTIAFELIYKRHGGVTEYSNSLSVDAPAPPSPVNPDDPENPLPHEDEDPGKEKLSSVWIGVIVGGSFLVVIAVLMIVGFILRKIYGPINLKKDGAGVEKLGGSTGNKDAAGATGVSQSEATKNVKYVTGPPEIELKAMGASNQNPQELTAPQRQLTQVYDDQFDKTDLSRNYEIDCPPVLSLPPQESIALPVVYNPITDDEKITDDITQD
ncbi:uncharacterized protein MONOS_1391 [Monocercomonoides exilis]|uniref:uncharacterized protein n=1 Tax=Monocercomonoides exilis TaxID=2049356 RepID=UPI003559758C|nr:hypothetical protein MONOS_1391 [Monocercomonoides exilis]|eukprot:MONOS_1391.1-p1 / transcript=MONOS_1391.1 / gene=MONOS_1391 / organism=Monocercomonoides_exilis_PA203 / gene_product=unspecified product / transcript_product=unspecified product / location=Mono_scaffold00024:86039-87382(+) / protein_length=448 / sequence_SO=supercontig / SO=protein_coding / is_pseudo=false